MGGLPRSVGGSPPLGGPPPPQLTHGSCDSSPRPSASTSGSITAWKAITVPGVGALARAVASRAGSQVSVESPNGSSTELTFALGVSCNPSASPARTASAAGISCAAPVSWTGSVAPSALPAPAPSTATRWSRACPARTADAPLHDDVVLAEPGRHAALLVRVPVLDDRATGRTRREPAFEHSVGMRADRIGGVRGAWERKRAAEQRHSKRQRSHRRQATATAHGRIRRFPSVLSCDGRTGFSACAPRRADTRTRSPLGRRVGPGSHASQTRGSRGPAHRDLRRPPGSR